MYLLLINHKRHLLHDCLGTKLQNSKAHDHQTRVMWRVHIGIRQKLPSLIDLFLEIHS